MITDEQFRRLIKMSGTESIEIMATKTGMSEKTARKYLKIKVPPSNQKKAHDWRTRKDIFEELWPKIEEMIRINPGLEATTLLTYFNQMEPEKFKPNQVRTLQRRMKRWRATEGPEKDIKFEQLHRPGELSESDFTNMNELGITIGGEHFKHLVYHFVLTYSNWEYGQVCFSESFEALSEGLQGSLWSLGRCPKFHRTDQMSAAVQKIEDQRCFTDRYRGLLNHYGIEGQKIQVGCPNENGDVEQRHHRFKRAVKQALMLRGSFDFETQISYEEFLGRLLQQLNGPRQEKLSEELGGMQALPQTRLDAVKYFSMKVRSGSTIQVERNTYSVDSRLIGERIDIKLYSNRLELWYGQKKRDEFPRLCGRGKIRIDYRHLIDSLVRKPGAFLAYRYREEMFPTSQFRLAYDWLNRHSAAKSSQIYLQILNLAAKESESKVDNALKWLFDEELPIEVEFVEDLVKNGSKLPTVRDIEISPINIELYDELFMGAAA